MIQWPDLTLPPLNLWNFPKQPNLYKGNTMNISMTDTNGTYIISLKDDIETLDEIIELMVKPLLRAAGFAEGSLDKFFIKDDCVPLPYEFDFDEEEEVFVKKAPVAKKAAYVND